MKWPCAQLPFYFIPKEKNGVEGRALLIITEHCKCWLFTVIWTKYKQHGNFVKDKRTGRPRKTSKRQDRKLKAICLKNRKCTGMGVAYRKANRKPSLTPKQKRTRL
uniref:Uncharacterized protein n=1 Tax=Gouania willdenowi TaxID=441366 RepID=A0A8C5GMG3_GOUWI